jgi:hypothetical protein
LTAEIEADETMMAELPESTEKIRKEASGNSRQSFLLCLKLKKLIRNCWKTSTRSYQMPPM